MNRYTIYCTEEQTKKALELGAPIEQYKAAYVSELFPYCVEYKDDVRVVTVYPTAEQMIGWLEEQENIAEICIKRYGNWRYEIYIEPYHHQEEGGFLSRKEATLAAIDKALEYLSKK